MKALGAIAVGGLTALVLVGCTGSMSSGNVEAARTETPLTASGKIPWEGGSEYWSSFAIADQAGWSDPEFFPIVLWYNGISTNEEVAYDKSLGFNTYIGMDESTPYRLFEDNAVFWIGDALNESFNDSSMNWVGSVIADEPDGKFADTAEGLASVKSEIGSKDKSRFGYINFSQMVIGQDLPAHVSEEYVNAGSDVASLDMYWYTVPFCDWEPRTVEYLNPVNDENCRTASSYGKAVDSLRQRDAVDGQLQPIWQFVEILNGGPGADQPFVADIKPQQLKGAVMNSLIHEARGIVYFNQSLNGPCTGGSLVRQTMIDPDFCAAAQVKAAGEVNLLIHKLAPVLNTQSVGHDFGQGIDSMLKVHDGFDYIFAMIDDSDKPGNRTFNLSSDMVGKEVQVLGEKRTLTVGTDGTFRDEFAEEYSYHVYKVES
ncbi:hypothetical protein [Arthrobacter rhombi]|uniref:hypothetical protein n=1 Tax=Arthrobacter rhombi TaxID=71253 RepID=UPI003FCF6D5E